MRVMVTGHRGFVGAAVCRRLIRQGHEVVPGYIEDDLPLHPMIDAVIHLAKPPSDGISTMTTQPFRFASGVLDLDLTVIRACAMAKRQPKLVCLGSVCAYPELAQTRPVQEKSLWSGYPEAVNAPYGIAKRMQLTLLHAARQETGLNGIHLIMANVYGPGDRSGHVIPATIRKMRERPDGTITVWGTPAVSRSFLFVDDAAEGIVRALETYNDPAPLNLAPTDQTTMDMLCHNLRHLTNFRGEIVYDATKPTGQRRRWYDTSRLYAALQWRPTTALWDGLRATVDWMGIVEKETKAEKEKAV